MTALGNVNWFYIAMHAAGRALWLAPWHLICLFASWEQEGRVTKEWSLDGKMTIRPICT